MNPSASSSISPTRPESRARLLWWALLALLLASAAAGCGRDRARYRWEKALLVADRHVDHRDYDSAEAAYEELAPSAPKEEFARYIAYRLAYIEELRGDYNAALSAYEPLWSGGDKDEYAGAALFRTGWVLYHDLGRTADGLDVYERIMTSMPSNTASKKAFQEILAHYRQGGELRAALGFIDSRYELLKGTEIGDNLMFRKAQLHRELGESEAALEAYRRVMDDHAASGLRDDAHWETATLLQELERYDEALTQLRFITEDQDSSWYVGSYNSQYVDDARYRRGLILLSLERYGEAAEEFRRFYEEFDTSFLRDDARWNVVQARLGAGDGEGAREACAALAESEPESRWVDDCQQVVASIEGGADVRSLRGEAAE